MLNELLRLAVSNLFRARARLLMTTGGVVVGTTAVTLLIALTFGLQNAAEAGIGQSAALTEINVYPAWDRPADQGPQPQLDLAAVRSFWQIPNVAAVIPLASLQTGAELIAGDYRGGSRIIGLAPSLLPYLGVTAQQGVLSLEPGQMIFGAMVGENFYDPTAEEWRPIQVDVYSTPLEMNVYSFSSGGTLEVDIEVSAVLAPNQPMFDYAIIMPIEDVVELNEWASGQPFDPETFRFDEIIVRATSRETTTEVTAAIKEMGFYTGGLGEFLNALNSFFTTMRLVLGGVGGIALLVAAFGVANTMMMAILERTKEIGLMKAVGATDQHVMTIFLAEAGLVGLSGGAAGVGVSLVLQNVVNEALRNAPADPQQGGGFFFLPINPAQMGGNLFVIPPELLVFAVLLATAVGLLAGLLPALRAARLPPVIALKSE
jgi:putative ABC transport system permease protein